MKSDPAKRVAILLTLISLLVAVAVASTGSVPVGTGGTRSPSDRFLDVAISLFLLWMAFGTVLLVLLIVNRRGVLAQAVVERRKGGRRNALVAGLISFGLLALFIRWLSTGENNGQTLLDRFRPGSRRANLDVSGAAPSYEPEFATGPVLIVLGVLAVAIIGWMIAYRARRRSLPPMPESALPGAHRRPGGDAGRPAGRDRSTQGGDRRLRPHGAHPRRLRPSPAPRGGT